MKAPRTGQSQCALSLCVRNNVLVSGGSSARRSRFHEESYALNEMGYRSERKGSRMGQTILVVDDHKPTVELIEDALKPHGFEVVSAGNGADCLVAVQEQQPDLVIMDVHMPVLSGLDALRLLRQSLADRELPVIILSGRGGFSDVRRAWKRGADIYLTKPVRVGAVVAAVKWLLRSDDGSSAREGRSGSGRVLSRVVTSDL